MILLIRIIMMIGVFSNITEAILVDEISTIVRIYPPKVITKIYDFLMKSLGSPNNGNICVFFAKCRESLVRAFRKMG